ncbi:MAG: GNAT family protein [Chloroflexota bacterium]
MTLIIEGKRLRLRDLKLEDIPHGEKWLHPDNEWHKTNGPYFPPAPADRIPDIMAMWKRKIEEDNYPAPRMRLCIADSETDTIMGMVTRYWISEETNWTAIGITIWNPEHWGMGFGYEAFGLWCDYLFAEEQSFVRLDARTWSGNHGMMRLAEKLGFTQEATFRMARIVNDEYYDGLGYGILRSEWEARYPDGFGASL